MSASITYMKAYLNGFGPNQSPMAFIDTLIRICDEMDNELDKMISDLSLAILQPGFDQAVVTEATDFFRRYADQQRDTFDFLHRTMTQQAELNSSRR